MDVGVGGMAVGFAGSVGIAVGAGVEDGRGVGVGFRARGRLEMPHARLENPRRVRKRILILCFVSIEYLIKWSDL